MPKQRGFGIFHILLIIVIGVGGVMGWKAYQRNKIEAEAKAAIEKERVETKKSFDDLRALFDKWSDAEKLASSAPRISLATPVASLQEIKRQTASTNVAPCLSAAKEALVDGMSLKIDAYISFMQRHSLDADLLASAEKFEEFVRLAKVCKEK